MQEARVQYGVQTTADVDSVLNDEDIDGVVIAAPAALHFQIAAKCLLHAKTCMLKTACAPCEEGRQLVQGVGTKTGSSWSVTSLSTIRDFRAAARSHGELGRLQISIPHASTWAKLRTEETSCELCAP